MLIWQTATARASAALGSIPPSMLQQPLDHSGNLLLGRSAVSGYGAWSGKAENVAAAQRAFAHRARMNSLAATGLWTPTEEKKAA